MSLRFGSLLRQVSIIKNISARFSYKSDLSLDKVYPGSVVKPFTPPVSEDGKFTGYIPIEKLTIKHCTASGPGGQNVNKRQTKVDIRFHVESADWLCEETKKKILENCKTRINKDGYLVIKSEKTKEAINNRLDAITKLRELIYKMEEPEKGITEETAELIRKRKEKAARQRLMEKRMNSQNRRARENMLE